MKKKNETTHYCKSLRSESNIYYIFIDTKIGRQNEHFMFEISPGSTVSVCIECILYYYYI